MLIAALCAFGSGAALAASPLNVQLSVFSSPEPAFRLDADYRFQRDKLFYAIELSNVFNGETGRGVSSLMLGGSWRPFDIPLLGLRVEVGAHTYLHNSDGDFAQNLLVHGLARMGTSLNAEVRIGRIERPIDERLHQPHADWNLLASAGALTYFDARLTTLTSTRQYWEYSVQAFQYEDGRAAMALATGGRLFTGEGWFSLQAGILFGDGHMKPLARLSYNRMNRYNGLFELAYQTASIFRPDAEVQLGYTIDAGWYQMESRIRWNAADWGRPDVRVGITASFF